MPKIILASGSAQRKALLEERGITFDIVVSNADETPIKALCLTAQMNDISMRKALTVMEMVKETEDDFIIVSADQNVLFNGVMYGKPNSIEEARELIKQMQGSNEIYAYVGNTVLHVVDSTIISHISACDIATLRMDYISDEELENYLATENPLSRCAGINISSTPGLHLEKGKMCTARGMTVDFLIEMLSQI